MSPAPASKGAPSSAAPARLAAGPALPGLCLHLPSESAAIWLSPAPPNPPGWSGMPISGGEAGAHRWVSCPVPLAGQSGTSGRGFQERAGRAQAGKARGVKFPEPLRAGVAAPITSVRSCYPADGH